MRQDHEKEEKIVVGEGTKLPLKCRLEDAIIITNKWMENLKKSEIWKNKKQK